MDRTTRETRRQSYDAVLPKKELSPEELERLKQMIREQPSTIIVGEVKP